MAAERTKTGCAIDYVEIDNVKSLLSLPLYEALEIYFEPRAKGGDARQFVAGRFSAINPQPSHLKKNTLQ